MPPATPHIKIFPGNLCLFFEFPHYYYTTPFLLSSHCSGRGKGVNTGRDDVEAYQLRGLGMLEVLLRVHCARTRIRWSKVHCASSFSLRPVHCAESEVGVGALCRTPTLWSAVCSEEFWFILSSTLRSTPLHDNLVDRGGSQATRPAPRASPSWVRAARRVSRAAQGGGIFVLG